MTLLFTLIELLIVIGIIAILAIALITVVKNGKASKALNKLKKKITAIQLAGRASADDCDEVSRLITVAKDAGIKQSVIDKLKEQISALCPQ
jgi:prepilin-type N-terminal cleavage/methylation domain-containing protein